MAENEHITKGRFKNPKTNKEGDWQQKQYNRYLAKYNLKQDTSPAGTRWIAQVHLMISWALPDEFIDMVLKEKLEIMDADFLRIAYCLTEDMTFIRDTFMGKTFAYEDGLKACMEYRIEKSYYVIQEIERLQVEKEQLAIQYEKEKEFLEKQLNMQKQLAETTQGLKEELAEKEKEMAVNKAVEEFKEREAEFKKREQEFKERVEELESLNQRQELATVDLLENSVENPESHIIGRKKGFISRLFHSSSLTKQQAFLLKILKRNSYEKEHLEILFQAAQNNLPVMELRQLADLELPTNNVAMLYQLFLKRHLGESNAKENNLKGECNERYSE